MMTLDCQHCGAKLALDGPSLPAEVRCKRCGRRTSTANAERARPASRKPEADPPTAEPRPIRMPPPSYPPPDVRVPPEEVFPRPKPRPGFYDSDSPLPDGKGKAIALIGGVLGVLVAFAAGAWWLLATAQPQTPFVGPTHLADATMPSDTRSAAGPVSGTTNPASARGQEQGARSTAPAGPATPPAPPAQPSPAPNAPSSTAAPGTGIRASGELLNEKLYIGSQLALTTYEESPRAYLDEQELFAELSKVVDASKLISPKTAVEVPPFVESLETALDSAERVRATMWLRENRPTFVLLITGIPRDGVELEAIIRCKDKAARVLVNGGNATKVSPLPVVPNEDGSARVPLVLRLEQSSAHALKAPTPIHLSIEARFRRGGQEIGRQEVQHTVTAYPASFVESWYPHNYGFAAMVDEDHPLVKQLIEAINSAPFCRSRGIELGGSGVDLTAVFAIWREFNARGIRYSSIAPTSDPDAQEVRTLSDALLSKNANCADGTALWCSILQKLGYQSSMIFVPGHVFVGLGNELPIWEDTSSRGGWVDIGKNVLPMALEATQIDKRDPCSPSFRKLIVEKFRLSKFESTLNSTDRAEWLAFLAAVESGMQQIQDAYVAAAVGGRSNGQDVPALQDIAKTMKSMLDGSYKNPDGSTPTESERKDLILEIVPRIMGANYIRILPIRSAREEGIRPIGCDPATLPKDGIGPLKAK